MDGATKQLSPSRRECRIALQVGKTGKRVKIERTRGSAQSLSSTVVRPLARWIVPLLRRPPDTNTLRACSFFECTLMVARMLHAATTAEKRGRRANRSAVCRGGHIPAPVIPPCHSRTSTLNSLVAKMTQLAHSLQNRRHTEIAFTAAQRAAYRLLASKYTHILHTRLVIYTSLIYECTYYVCKRNFADGI